MKQEKGKQVLPERRRKDRVEFRIKPPETKDETNKEVMLNKRPLRAANLIQSTCPLLKSADFPLLPFFRFGVARV